MDAHGILSHSSRDVGHCVQSIDNMSDVTLRLLGSGKRNDEIVPAVRDLIAKLIANLYQNMGIRLNTPVERPS